MPESDAVAELRRRDLRVGDLLFARGSARLGSPISDLICELDGGRYSHVALWDGTTVLEASGSGGKVRVSDLDGLIAEHEFTHVYRFAPGDSPGGPAGRSLDAVVDVARSYVGSAYPYGELCLVGVMIALGRVSCLPQAEQVLRRVGGELARLLRQRLEDAGQTAMTCSQFVSMAFWKADPSQARSLALRVRYESRGWARAAQAEPLPEQWLGLVRDCERAFLAGADPRRRAWTRDPARGHHGSRALGVGSQEVRAGDRSLPLPCVTPRDLERSPSLALLGALA